MINRFIPLSSVLLATVLLAACNRQPQQSVTAYAQPNTAVAPNATTPTYPNGNPAVPADQVQNFATPRNGVPAYTTPYPQTEGDRARVVEDRPAPVAYTEAPVVRHRRSRPVVIRHEAPAVQRETVVERGVTYTGPRYVTKNRTKKKSAAIVVGSAGAGAAIGALAGGGKGAGIGALAGGVGGFIYDRMTAHKRVAY